MAKNWYRRKHRNKKTKGSMSERSHNSNSNRQPNSKRKTTDTTNSTTGTAITNDTATQDKSETLSRLEMQQTDCDISRDQFRPTVAILSNDNTMDVTKNDRDGDNAGLDETNNGNNSQLNSMSMHGDEETTDDNNSEGDSESVGDATTGSYSNNDKHMRDDDDISTLMDDRENADSDDGNDEKTDTKTKTHENNNNSCTNDGSTSNKKRGKSDAESRNSDKFKCPVCGLKLDSQHTFTLHIRQHNPSDHSHTCRLCGKTLSSASSLDRHMLIHSGERPFKCRICNMAFTTNGNMHRHMRTHGMELNEEYNANSDGNNNKFKTRKRKCSEDANSSTDCGTSETKSPKRRHSECDESSVSSVSIIRDAQCYCPICNKPFASKSALHSHMECHPNDPICCRDCGMILNNYATYTQHRCTATATDPTTGFYNVNKMNFSTAPSLGFFDLSFTDFSSGKFAMIAKSFCEHNLRKVSSQYHDFECDKCHKAFPCGSALNLHQSSHNGNTFCGLCHCDFPTPATFLSHQIKHRFDYQLFGSTIPPPHGFTSPTHGTTLNGLHNNTYGDVPHSEKDDFLALLNLQNKGSNEIGLESNYKFVRHEDAFENASYYIHAKPIPPQPTTFKPKIVSKCTDVEASKPDLADIQSIISVTSSATPLIASIRSSPPAASPASPVQLGSGRNKPDSPVPADSANASPNTPVLNNCKKSESPEKNQNNDSPEKDGDADDVVDGEAELESLETLKCNRCNLLFKSSNALKRHNRGHIQGGHSYACHLCPYTSLDKSTLVRHLRTHNGERPFQCAICKYAFTTKANCERHVRKRHKKLNKQEIRNAMQYNPNMSTSTNVLSSQNLTKLDASNSNDSFPGGFDTICKYCNVDFKFNRVLRHHLRSLHNSCSRKPYTCTMCKLGFSTKNNCIRHVMKQHSEMKDKLSNVVIANSASVGSNSDHSESESLQSPSPSINQTQMSQSNTNDSINQSPDDSNNKMDSIDSHPHTPSPPLPSTQIPQQSNSSFAALCQIARNISIPNETPINLAIGSTNKSPIDTVANLRRFNDQPLNLANTSSEEQPLDLAVHALDLSCKSNFHKEKVINDDPKHATNEAVRNAASSLLALRSMTTSNVFSSGAFLAGAFHPNVSLTPPLPAHSSPSIPMISPVSNSSMEEIYKAAATFRIAKNRLMPRNERSFTCIYCSAGFTLKSNMERHIKRKHPEFARPPRSRGHSANASSQGSAHSNSTASLLSRSNSNATLSSKTRAALRVVLSNKVMASSSSSSFPAIQSNTINSVPVSPLGSNHSDLRISEDGGDGNGGDLASVSSLIDHSANSSNALKQYFNKSNDDADSNVNETNSSMNSKNPHQSHSVRPNDAIKYDKSDRKKGNDVTNNTNNTNNSDNVNIVVKKRSAYTDSPNSVSCPYCSRKFPWTSSLRRHILTHTGLKPFKCPKCPILFTTKSNCERHLVRKHNGKDKRNTSDSVYSALTQENKQFKSNIRSGNSYSIGGNIRKHHYLRQWTKTGKNSNNFFRNKKSDKNSDETNETIQCIPNDNSTEDSNNRFKCYLCELSFSGREKCLLHLQSLHSNEYQILLSKGAVDKMPTPDTKLCLDDNAEECDPNRQEKIFCVFCPRQFLSMENMRRHMRVHLGERPFKCTLCTKRFSLKNSLLRHYRTNHPDANIPKGKSKLHNNEPLISKSLESESQLRCKPSKSKGSCNSLLYLIPKGNISKDANDSQQTDVSDNDNNDLIQNLLGIQDSKMIDEMLNSADSAARILGVKDAL